MESQQPLDAFGHAEEDAEDQFNGANGVYRWVPDGTSCDRCQAEVNRLWRDGMLDVCPECKSW